MSPKTTHSCLGKAAAIKLWSQHGFSKQGHIREGFWVLLLTCTNAHTATMKTVEQLTGTLERVKEAVEEVTGSLSTACTGLFDDAFTISKTSWTERQGESRGELSKWIKQRQDTRAELCLSPCRRGDVCLGVNVSHCLKLRLGRTLELSSTGQQLPSRSPWYHPQ